MQLLTIQQRAERLPGRRRPYKARHGLVRPHSRVGMPVGQAGLAWWCCSQDALSPRRPFRSAKFLLRDAQGGRHRGAPRPRDRDQRRAVHGRRRRARRDHPDQVPSSRPSPPVASRAAAGWHRRWMPPGTWPRRCRIDFSPAALRQDLAGPRSAPGYLYAAAELINQAADLAAASSVLPMRTSAAGGSSMNESSRSPLRPAHADEIPQLVVVPGLHGVLDQVRDFGIELVAVEPVDIIDKAPVLPGPAGPVAAAG